MSCEGIPLGNAILLSVMIVCVTATFCWMLYLANRKEEE